SDRGARPPGRGRRLEEIIHRATRRRGVRRPSAGESRGGLAGGGEGRPRGPSPRCPRDGPGDARGRRAGSRRKALTIETIRIVMVTRKAIASLLEDYEDIVVATVCSHSSLQIFHGARQEGFRTLGIAIGQRPRFYDAFPLAKPDEFLIVDSYADILDQADDLVARQAVTVPHGSFVEYMGAEVFAKLRIPTFGNREVLRWESDREKQREWLTSAGVPMPQKIEHPKDIDRPVFVKYYGAKGGRGSFIAKNYED